MRTRRAPTSLTSTDELLAALRAGRLLSSRRIDRLAASWLPLLEDVGARVRELVAAGALTAYQAEQVLAGKAHRLRLGPYCILDRLGHGGQGQVFKAKHGLMKRIVALKVFGKLRPQDRRGRRTAGRPPSSVVIDPRSDLPPRAVLLENFRREVQAAAHLSHPHIVTAYDAAEARGLLFLVMEYVEGIDLARLVAEEGPLPVESTVEYVRQAALALQYANERGLVHGDVKPSNLLLARTGPEEGTIKLLDLGLARRMCGPREAAAERELAGTPDFMAPELSDDPAGADVRSDLYSLGCTFYFLLTGQVPFPGKSWTEKILRHQLDVPTWVKELRPEVPEEVAAIVHRLLAKDAADRFATPADVVAALGEWLASGGREGEAPAEPRAEDSAGASPSPKRPVFLGSHVKRALAGAVAVMVGLLAARGARWAQAGRSAERELSPPVAGTPKPIETKTVFFLVEGSAARYETLEAAIAAAPDGGTVTIHGNGIMPTPPVSLRGKALTLRAAPGCKPCLQIAAKKKDDPPWRALLTTDRPLSLEDLFLRQQGLDEEGHLVYSERAAVRLTRCRLESPGGAAIVCRNGPEVRVRDCVVEAGPSAVSIEVGQPESFRLEIAGSTLRVAQTTGPALSIWAPEVRRPTRVELRLERNVLECGRVAAFTALPAELTILANENDWTYREALLSYAGWAEPDAWRRLTRWQGWNNRYRGPGSWLSVDGRPEPVAGLAGWLSLWGTSEPGSREVAESSSPSSSTLARGVAPNR
jgi:hypothetical protein